MARTCALDVIDQHPEGLRREEIADVLGVIPERTRMMERMYEAKLRESGILEEWRGHRTDASDDDVYLTDVYGTEG